jgi:tryptophan synthase beta subunit
MTAEGVVARADGFYGEYGGAFVPETLVPALAELADGWDELSANRSFQGRARPSELFSVAAPSPPVPAVSINLLWRG